MTTLEKQLKALGNLLNIDVWFGAKDTLCVNVYRNKEKSAWTCYVIYPTGKVHIAHVMEPSPNEKYVL
jgi:hypothetical protein